MRRIARRLRSLAASLRGPKPVILMYHRIAIADTDPWGTSVAPAQFEEQLVALKQHREVLPLQEFARLHRAGRLPPLAAAVTFDDGYACNETVAAPLLAVHGLPATFFITTGAVGGDREFWWDDLERLVLGAPAGSRISVPSRGEVFTILLDQPRGRPARHAFESAAGNSRQDAYIALWRVLREVNADDQVAALDRIRSSFGAPSGARPSHRPMTIDEVRELSRRSLVEIGAHTATHPALGQLSPRRQLEEIMESRVTCEALCNRLPQAFAYPYGDCTDTTIALVRDAGFMVACTTHRAPVTPRRDVLSLPRLQVLNWYTAPFLRALDAASHGLPPPAASPTELADA